MTSNPHEAARILSRHAKPYAYGAFATPTAKDLSMAIVKGQWKEWGGAWGVTKRMDRDTLRRDWTGRRYTLPKGTLVITHLAADPAITPDRFPDLSAYSRVYAYAGDPAVTAAMTAQGREVYAVSISASSTVTNCWGRKGGGHAYDPADTATLAQLDIDLPEGGIERAAAEASKLSGWTDSYPFYSDGTWGSLDLRGFKPDDPTWGIKPSEMSKAWWRDHPEAARLTVCKWTRLAEDMPYATDLAASFMEYGELERVRLLRMAGTSGTGKLGRHTDITDRAAGTRDGKIVRFHIPLITSLKATMTAWNLRDEGTECHLGKGSAYYLDARKPHAVRNASGRDRIHLVVDVKANAKARAVITAAREFAA